MGTSSCYQSLQSIGLSFVHGFLHIEGHSQSMTKRSRLSIVRNGSIPWNHPRHMAYATNNKLPDVRRRARELIKEGWSTRKVARHLGYTQGAIVKWSHRKTVDTLISRPKKSPRALPEDLRARIIAKR